MKGKCIYWKTCRMYQSCIVCNEMEGFAYGHRAGGCYRDISKYGEKSTYSKVADERERKKELIVHPA